MPGFDKLAVLNKMAQAPVVPVFYHNDAATACKVLKACYDGGIRAFEFTNRGDFAHEVFAEVVRFAAAECPEMAVEDFRRVIDIDLVGPFICAKAVIPGMIKKGHGKIINICSMMSELGRETVSAYAAAKGGLKMLTRNICSEYGEHNIQCNAIGPGYIATEQTAPLRERQADGSRHPFDSFIISKTPAARWGKPEDLMGPAVFLASDASDFVNGHILYVDGGILAYIGKQPK